MATLRSTPRASTTPSARVARNLAGTVRRFLASSVYSKVPRKATGDVPGGGVRIPSVVVRTEVAEWEEPRHPGPAARDCNPLSPTFQPFLHLSSHDAFAASHARPGATSVAGGAAGQS